VSHTAIAAALALTDATAGQRLCALSLASFANREHQAWPGNRVAAARAGLSGRFHKYAAFGGVWTRLTDGGEPAGPPVRLASPPSARHAQPLANHPRTCETDH
jgi:hypothetical protein